MATIEEFRRQLKVDLDFLDKDVKFLLQLGQQAFVDSKVRIFSDGKKSDSTQIGTYAKSTEKSKKRRGRFSSSVVNLRETEKLVDSYLVGINGDVVELGFADVTRRTSNDELVGFLEEKYGDIFGLTDQELANLDLIIDQRLNEIL